MDRKKGGATLGPQKMLTEFESVPEASQGCDGRHNCLAYAVASSGQGHFSPVARVCQLHICAPTSRKILAGPYTIQLLEKDRRPFTVENANHLLLKVSLALHGIKSFAKSMLMSQGHLIGFLGTDFRDEEPALSM